MGYTRAPSDPPICAILKFVGGFLRPVSSCCHRRQYSEISESAFVDKYRRGGLGWVLEGGGGR